MQEGEEEEEPVEGMEKVIRMVETLTNINMGNSVWLAADKYCVVHDNNARIAISGNVC